MTKQQRYAIHYAIIAIICLIPTILSVDTFIKLRDKTDNFPETVYKISSSGVITNKFSRGDKNYVVINDKEERVTYSVVQNYKIGDKITLQSDNGIKVTHFLRIALMFVVIFGLIVLSIFLVCFSFEVYFKWLKGSEK